MCINHRFFNAFIIFYFSFFGKHFILVVSGFLALQDRVGWGNFTPFPPKNRT